MNFGRPNTQRKPTASVITAQRESTTAKESQPSVGTTAFTKKIKPVEIAAAAFQCHQSQMPSRHSVSNEGVYSLSDFGLAYTAVGPDTPGVNDPFEHIDPATIHGVGTPATTQTPEP